MRLILFRPTVDDLNVYYYLQSMEKRTHLYNCFHHEFNFNTQHEHGLYALFPMCNYDAKHVGGIRGRKEQEAEIAKRRPFPPMVE